MSAGDQVIKQAIEGNPMSEIEQLRRDVDALISQVMELGRLDSATANLGSITGGDWRFRDDNDMIRLILSGVNLVNEIGVSAYLAALNATGIPNFWVDADNGSGTFGGGAVTADDDGLSFNDMNLGLQFTQIADDLVAFENGNIGLGWVSGIINPALQMIYCGELGTDLWSTIVGTGAGDGGFEIQAGLGLGEGWVYGAGWSQDTVKVRTGTYCAKIVSGAGELITSIYFDLSGAKTAYILAFTQIETGGVLYGKIKWYDAANVLISEDYFLVDQVVHIWRGNAAFCVAPSGATKFKIAFTGTNAYVDDTVFSLPPEGVNIFEIDKNTFRFRGAAMEIEEQGTPTLDPLGGYRYLYPKTTGWYEKLPSGVEKPVSPILMDEFTSGLLTTGNVGALGWLFLNTPTIASVASTAEHPGQISIATPASAAVVGLALNPGTGVGGLLGDDIGYMRFIIKPVTNFTTAGSMRFGFLTSAATGETANGYYFSRLHSDTTWFAVKTSGGTPTRTDTGVTWTANNWYVLEIVHVGTDYKYYINGALVATHAEVATLKTLGGYYAMVVETTNTTLKQIIVDAFEGAYSLGQRYT